MIKIFLRKHIAPIILCATMVLSYAVCAFSVKDTKALLSVDEAAWIYDSYYLDLYLSGDWKSGEWHSLDKYAKHPPAGGYLFGIVMRAIGEEVKTSEPAHFWNENDLSKSYDPASFFEGIYKRLSFRQVMAGRYTSMFFGWLTIMCLTFVAYRLTGPVGAVACAQLLIFNPMFLYIASMATADMFVIFLSTAAILLSLEMAHRADKILVSCSCAAVLSVILGIALATKISSYALMPAILFSAIVYAGKGERRKIAAMAIASIIAALLIAYLLDPALHGDPVGVMLERAEWRMKRVDIQQFASPYLALPSLLSRLHHDSFTLFFMNTKGFILFLLVAAGLAAPIFRRERKRTSAIVIFLGLYGFALTIILSPLALIRYVIAYLPMIVLLAGLGADALKDLVVVWPGLKPAVRFRTMFMLLALSSIAMFIRYNVPTFIVEEPPPMDEASWRVVHDYEMKVMNSGEEGRR